MIVTNVKQTDGVPIQAESPRVGTSYDVGSFDFCHKETWYSQSELHENQTLTNINSGLVWESPHEYWVDVVSGKILNQAALQPYVQQVWVNGVLQTPRGHFATTGGDYTIDYANGRVTFFESQAGNTVIATYYSVAGPWWELVPPSGYKMVIEDAEAQFTVDVGMTDALDMRIFVGEALVLSMQYETIRQILTDVRGAYPVVPAVGGASRGVSHDVITLPFRYRTIRELSSSLGMKLQIGCRNGVPMTGEMLTATFYTTLVLEE